MTFTPRQREMLIAAAGNRNRLTRMRVSYQNVNSRRGAWYVGRIGFAAMVGDTLEDQGLIARAKSRLDPTGVVLTNDGAGVVYTLTIPGILAAQDLVEMLKQAKAAPRKRNVMRRPNGQFASY